jgi:hypothetical protein
MYIYISLHSGLLTYPIYWKSSHRDLELASVASVGTEDHAMSRLSRAIDGLVDPPRGTSWSYELSLTRIKIWTSSAILTHIP